MKRAVSYRLSALSQRMPTGILALVVAALMGGLTAPVLVAGVEAEVSSRETQVGVPIVLQITVEDGDQQRAPTIPLIPGVTVRSGGVPSQSSQTFFANGVVQSRSTLTYAFELTPSKEGRFTIPTINIATKAGIQKTSPMTIVVTKSQTRDRLFAGIRGDRQKVYVGESLNLTLQIYIKPANDLTGRPLPVQVMWNFVDLRRSQWGSFFEPLQRELNTQRTVSGRQVLRKDSEGTDRNYYLYELIQKIQANRPGPMAVEDMSVVVVYPDRLGQSWMGRTEVVAQSVLSAQPKLEPIAVLPVPTQGRPAYFSGAVGTYTVEATAKPTEVAVGDPITLGLTVGGTGNLQDLQPPPLAQMPELTGHFRLPSDPLAGEVTPTGKKFTVSIRATSASVSEIPAIPFAYFDPRQEKFVTVCTQPIPLTVKPADKLAMSQIVDATGGHVPAANRLTESAGGILANYTGMDEVLTQQGFTPGPAMWVALMLPPVGFAATWALRRRNERLRTDIGFARKRRARRDAVHRLRQIQTDDTNQAAAMVSSALGHYVADRCNLPVGGMTRAAVVQQLKERGAGADMVAGMDTLLGECESIHYGGAGTRSAAELRQVAMSCVDRLEREKW